MQAKLDNRYMELRVGEQLYAVHLLSVREVIQKPEIVQVPNSPSYFEGMMNLRGQIMGVFSLGKKLGIKASSSNRSTPSVVVVIEEGDLRTGILVDEVTRVLHPGVETVRPAPVKQDDVEKIFVESIIQTESEYILVLNISQFLNLKKNPLEPKVQGEEKA